MLSAVPVPRLLEGIAAALRNQVQPHVTDRFAQMQLRAMDEVLRNLAQHVNWSLTEVAEEIDEIERMLAKVEQTGWLHGRAACAPPPGSQAEWDRDPSGTAALRRRSEALLSLREALTWIEQVPSDDEATVSTRSAIVKFLSTAISRERIVLRSGMYS